MRVVHASAIALAVALLVPVVNGAPQGDPDRVVPGGGITVKGWQGKIDSQSVAQGRVVNDAKLSQDGTTMHLETGPAIVYWNPANVAKGDYTIKATFKEPKYMEFNSHPHSYGIFIGGNNMGTDTQSLMYCTPYGDGTYIVRGFGPAPWAPASRAKAANDAVHKAAGKGEPVTQEVQWSVKGNRAECSINGTVVVGYDKSELIGAGKLTSLDGVYGIRATHNVEAFITGFGMSK